MRATNAKLFLLRHIMLTRLVSDRQDNSLADHIVHA